MLLWLKIVPKVPELHRHCPMAVEPVLAVDVPLGQVVQSPTVAAPVAPLYVPFGHAAKSGVQSGSHII